MYVLNHSELCYEALATKSADYDPSTATVESGLVPCQGVYNNIVHIKDRTQHHVTANQTHDHKSCGETGPGLHQIWQNRQTM